MGAIRFSIETDDFVTPESVTRADFVTFDGRVIPCDSTLAGRELHCSRPQSDSSKLRLLCRVGDQAEFVLQTASLRENGQVYRLETELARGELSRLRNFYSLWTSAGLKTDSQLDEMIADAHRGFRTGVFSAESGEATVQSIVHTHRAIDLLVSAYVQQRVTFRRQRTQRFPMFVGCQLTEPPLPEHEPEFLQTFNAVQVQTPWRDLEPCDGTYEWESLDRLVDWATSQRLLVAGGSLLDLSSDRFPEWLGTWKGDAVNLQSFASDFVETVVSRYVGRIRHWEVVCGPNRGGASDLTEEQRLNLILRTVEAAQQVDEQIQISLRVVQPWGEYLSTTDNRLPPIQFVDTLRRSGANLAEVNLDLRFGLGELCSQPRDMLNVSQLLDHWSLLQLPINVMATLPERTPALNPTLRMSDLAQVQHMQDLFLMCLSKERVTGFYCLNWNDHSAPDEPLISSEGTRHSLIGALSDLKQRCWTE